MFYTGRLRREVQPLVHLYTLFAREGTPYTYLASIGLRTPVPAEHLRKCWGLRDNLEPCQVNNEITALT